MNFRKDYTNNEATNLTGMEDLEIKSTNKAVTGKVVYEIFEILRKSEIIDYETTYYSLEYFELLELTDAIDDFNDTLFQAIIDIMAVPSRIPEVGTRLLNTLKNSNQILNSNLLEFQKKTAITSLLVPRSSQYIIRL